MKKRYAIVRINRGAIDDISYNAKIISVYKTRQLAKEIIKKIPKDLCCKYIISKLIIKEDSFN